MEPADRASPGSIQPDPHTPPRDVSKRRVYRPDAPDSPYLSRILQVVREEFADMVDEPEMNTIIAAIVSRVECGT